jgi:hypothetical protein
MVSNDSTSSVTPDYDLITRAALREWRETLIDLSGRNRLINFRPGVRTSAVEFFRPGAAEILSRFGAHRPLFCRTVNPVVDPEIGSQPEPPPRANTLDSRKPEQDFEAALRQLKRRSDSELLDKGLWVLYLAIGLLKWVDEDKSVYKSPLLLVPVRLTRTTPQHPWLLDLAEEDATLNPALTLKLERLNVVLPSFDELDDEFDVDAYLGQVQSTIQGQRDWEVLPETHLSFFSFHKEAMYRDLLANEDLIVQHSAVTALACGGRGDLIGDFLFDEISDDEVDQRAAPESTSLALDADSSQRACIAAALDGKSFVMDGPPGTGKSQTIANMIGVLLGVGKTVLFVSEKAAALDVVRKRLVEVGLDAYLLELHSHKTTRKHVATVLGESLGQVPVPPRAMSEPDRGRATERRRALSAYAAAMNVVREPLGLSLHDVLGVIAMLNDVPAAPNHDAAQAALASQDMLQIRQAAGEIARAWRPAAQGASFAWRGVTEQTSMDALLQGLSSALEELRGVAEPHQRVGTAFGLTGTSSAETLNRLLDLSSTRPSEIPESWLLTEHFDQVKNAVGDLLHDLVTICDAQEQLNAVSGVPWNAVPTEVSCPAPDANALTGLTPPGLNVRGFTADFAASLANSLAADVDLLEGCVNTVSGIAALLGLPSPPRLAGAEELLGVAGLAYQEDCPDATWLSDTGYEAARHAMDVLMGVLQQRGARETDARQYFTEAVLNLDLQQLVEHFPQQHGLKKLGSEYRAQRRAIAATKQPAVSLSDAVAHLDTAAAWKKSIHEVVAAEALHGPALGEHYQGQTTDFRRTQRAIVLAYGVLKLFGSTDLTRLAAHLRNEQSNPTIHEVVASALGDLQRWKSSLAPAPAASGRPELLDLSFHEVCEWLRTHVETLRESVDFTRRVSASVGRVLSFEEALHFVQLRAKVETAVAVLRGKGPDYSGVCEGLFDGERTDADQLRSAITWAAELRSLVGSALDVEQWKSLLLASPSPSLPGAIASWNRATSELFSVFDEARRVDLQVELDDYDDAQDLIDALIADPGGVDDWFAYQLARQHLGRFGLTDAIDFCVSGRIPASQVPRVIERAVLQRWADQVLATDQTLQPLRSTDRDALVDEYRTLDRQLIASAASSIIASLNRRRPRGDAGESAIIRREATKKRKHMPVRTLLAKTKHVTQIIKPCFMMSPLTVSQFLPATLDFDVIIFDEASQVSPGDAINCVYRGRSLIVAGDDKQLPPTAFFTSSDSDNSDEWSEEDVDAKDFESILDLVKGSGSFRSLTLRWHYRSRHESLIAFSNATFYDGRLVTFPSSQIDSPDVGIELYRVDGVYRRGTSRDNPVEAEKVAERVIHHFSTRPELTLGVVTFSESQAYLIEQAVETARQSHPHLDRYFTDDRLDGFFVKSLESVQGDERDVMIFSIGYGPDEFGKMQMNFGPVNKAGGWRRLNVAITRARFRNEIVSSVRAADISTGSANDGVRHLRRYLDYAERGLPALGLDDVGSKGDPESPFEESVLGTIRSWGFDATPQVGAASYRIDIGVRHPEHPGGYLLGVECDGYMYHSSRVARDRDRLREQVLRRLGWTLHRIWGTAWYRNRQGEEERLRSAIDYALSRPMQGLMATSEVTDDEIVRAVVEVETVTLAEKPIWALPYQVAQVPPLPRWCDPSSTDSFQFMIPAVTEVARVEGPVHMSLVHQRLREAWNIGRVGSIIRRNVDAAIYRAPVTRKGDFLIVPDAKIHVRTPVSACSRTIDQVADDELATALYGYIHDSIGVNQDELTAGVARLFGWNRRGNGIQARLDDLIQRLLNQGYLQGNREGLSLDPSRGKQ